jgi:DNA polymerase
MRDFVVKDFAHWRTIARNLIAEAAEPGTVDLHDNDSQQSLFGSGTFDNETRPLGGTPPKNAPSARPFRVSREFLNLAETVGYHRAANRWNLLYRTLWRIVNGQRHLLRITTDDDVLRLNKFEKEVRRDAHKMKAFVRFRKVIRDGEEFFVAWHRPDHRIVRKIAPFFSRRFKGMNWTIMTPEESVVWDQTSLTYGDGVPRSQAPDGDELEDLWKTYYANIFNPARIKIKMMKSEMPVRYWSTMPETEIIDQLLADAPRRVAKMIRESEGFATTAADVIAQADTPPSGLEDLKSLASTCSACDLHLPATQTVFGEGPMDARLVFVGEQPGDQEDIAGRPFVGPAGQVLNDAFAAAEIDRDRVYLTNMVKHFKHQVTQTPRGKKRLHQRPDAREVRCCRPWFVAEWNFLTQARVLVCLGATSAQSILGPNFRLSKQRGEIIESDFCPQTIATWHPSAILRAGDPKASREKLAQLVNDIQLAVRHTSG